LTFVWNEIVVPEGGVTATTVGSLPRSVHPPARSTAATDTRTGNNDLIPEGIAEPSVDYETHQRFPAIIPREAAQAPLANPQEQALPGCVNRGVGTYA
jgi:hypothetical protein